MNKEKQLIEWMTDLINNENIVFKNKLIKTTFDLDFEYEIEFYIENLWITLNSHDSEIIIKQRERDIFSEFENKFNVELEYCFIDTQLFYDLFMRLNKLHKNRETTENESKLEDFFDMISDDGDQLEKEMNYLQELSIRSDIAKDLILLKHDNGDAFFDEEFILKNILNLSDADFKDQLMYHNKKKVKEIDDKISIIKVDRDDKEFMDNIDYVEYVGDSRIDGSPMYKINLPIIEVIKKIE